MNLRLDRSRPSLDTQINQLYTFTLSNLSSTSPLLSNLPSPNSSFQQLSILKQILSHLLTPPPCQDCSVYEKELQKLEADIRQHIKLEHQLKLYQDSLQERASESKREWTGVEKEVEGYRKKIEGMEGMKKENEEKIVRLREENETLKMEIKTLNRKRRQDGGVSSMGMEMSRERQTQCQSVERRQIAKRLQAKTMLIERAPLTKTINFNSTTEERKSIDRKGITITQDMGKHRQSLTNKSSGMLKSSVGLGEKERERERERKKLEIVMRDKENEKRKINKVEYRR